MHTIKTSPQEHWKIDFILPVTKMKASFLELQYDNELDNVLSLINDVCGQLAESKAQFIVVSPELGTWPVDVETDLTVFIDQIPAFLRFLHDPSLKLGNLYFDEQGIQQRIEMEKIGKTLMVTRISWLESHSPEDLIWQHPIERSICELTEWQSMIVSFWEKFCQGVSMVAPSALQHPWWKEWIGDTKG